MCETRTKNKEIELFLENYSERLTEQQIDLLNYLSENFEDFTIQGNEMNIGDMYKYKFWFKYTHYGTEGKVEIFF